MTVKQQIKQYIATQPAAKRSEMEELHQLVLKTFPDLKLWFDDGMNSDGKVVSNPSIGYGTQTLKYADGKTKEFFQIGLSGNTSGFSVYILGIKDKTYLLKTYGSKIGKAKITGYCIKFKTLKDVDVDVLLAAMRYGVKASA